MVDFRRQHGGCRERGCFDYLALARLLRPAPGTTVGDVIGCKGTLYWRLVEPLLLAALNIDRRAARRNSPPP